jgi:hypothetical protein
MIKTIKPEQNGEINLLKHSNLSTIVFLDRK